MRAPSRMRSGSGACAETDEVAVRAAAKIPRNRFMLGMIGCVADWTRARVQSFRENSTGRVSSAKFHKKNPHIAGICGFSKMRSETLRDSDRSLAVEDKSEVE